MTALIPAFFNLGTSEIILIVFVILLLFGAKKIPELMRSVGNGINSFKQGMNDMTDELNNPRDKKSSDKDSKNEDSDN